MRVTNSNSQLPCVERGRPVTLQIDGQQVRAFEGETISGAMFAEGRRILRHTIQSGKPRSIFCGIGVCYECLVTVNGTPNIRACQTPVAEGMIVQTQSGGQS